jgi:hypothetical protein
LKEALSINSSLTALGKVVMALDPTAENTHIPYRDSKLTRVLQNSLGGNSYTVVLAAIHPLESMYEECLSTLQFANRCKNVRNNPRVNHLDEVEDKDKKIKRLMEEITQLRLKLNEGGGGGTVGGSSGSAPLSPGKLMSLLKKMGIQSSVSVDGGLLVNGKVVDINDLATDNNTEAVSGNGEIIINNIYFLFLIKLF